MVKPNFISEEQFTALQDKVRGGVVRHATADPKHATFTGTLLPRTARISGINSAPSPIYKSKWEASYASKLELEKRAGEVKTWWYEPFSLWLPGKIRYKPDFMIQYTQGNMLELIEVKGWSRNRRDGMTRLKIAAALFPCFVWRMVYRTKGGGWDGEYV